MIDSSATIASRQVAAPPVGVPRQPSALGAYYLGVLILLYLPIAILFLFSVNANTTLSFPLQGLTLNWYSRLLEADAVWRSVATA